MSITFDKHEKYLVVNMEGKVDNKTAPEIQTALLRESLGFTYIIIDMSKVDYMSSAGLRVLLLLYRQVKAKNGTVCLCGVSDEIKEVLKITGFVNFFKFSDSIAESIPNN
jgi:anti-sigma B factor antagonist